VSCHGPFLPPKWGGGSHNGGAAATSRSIIGGSALARNSQSGERHELCFLLDAQQRTRTVSGVSRSMLARPV
jgi:hypothetical protein